MCSSGLLFQLYYNETSTHYCLLRNHKASILFGVVQRKRLWESRDIIAFVNGQGGIEFLFDLHRKKLKLERNRNKNFCPRIKLPMTFRIIILSNQPGFREHSQTKRTHKIDQKQREYK